METMSFCLSVCGLVSTNERLSDFREVLGKGVLYKELSNKRECREIWLPYSTEKWKLICVNFLISRPISLKFGTSCLHLTLSSTFELWEALMNLCLYCHMYWPSGVKFDVRDLRVLLVSICQFREIRRREGRTFCKVICEIIFRRLSSHRMTFKKERSLW
jgi:hypothetical protein